MGKRRRKGTWGVVACHVWSTLGREVNRVGVYRAVGGWRGLLIALWGCVGLAAVGLLIVLMWV